MVIHADDDRVYEILDKPYDETTDADVQEARRLASSLADSVRQGADIQRLAETYGERGDVEKASEQQVPVNQIQSQLGQAYAKAIGSSPDSGSVVGPFEVSGPSPQAPSFAVVLVANYRPAGRPDLAEVRDRIRTQIRRQKQFQQLLERLRDEFFVEIKI
ncbi:MAG: peptidylprolyl isomerase, partial [Gemmatimonadota bacterium]